MKQLLLAAVALAPVAFAADPAAAATPPAVETVAPAQCLRPQIQLDGAGKIKNAKELQAQVNTYQSCVDAYVSQRRQVVDQHEAIAKANRDASNAAVKEFNDFAAELSAAQQPKK
ncbi:MAG TPA: hypothetical protein VFA75_12885 [Nevskia sp.]|nr:hypothetical protein [Nevskia sp.]